MIYKDRLNIGFTIVEIMSVLVIISILIGVGIMIDRSTKYTYRSARDSERAADVESLAMIFESYYRRNVGSYPKTTQAVATVSNTELLRPPGVTVNSLVSPTTGAVPTNVTIKQYSYQPLQADGSICSGTAPGPCVRFFLYYVQETDGQMVTLESSHQQ